MKIIVDLEKKSLRMLENERSIFRGEKSADKLELYINKSLVDEFPTITALLSNGRRLGAYSTDSEYRIEYIDDIQYTIASFTLSKENGFTLSEGKMQITIWMNTINGKREAIGNVLVNVVNTTAYDDGDIIISGDDVEGTVVNFKIELENLQSQINSTNLNFAELKSHNLGEVGNPFLAQNNILNSIVKNGLYTFKWFNVEHLMLVSDAEGAGIHQFIIRGVNTDAEYIIRKSTDNGVTWTVSDGVISSKQYVQEQDSILNNAITVLQNYFTNGIANQSERDSQGNIIHTTYATKTELPTKLSQLLNDEGYITKNAYDLGSVMNPSYQENRYLNVVTQNGLYTFNYNGMQHLMLVSNIEGIGISQFIVSGYNNDIGNDTIKYIIRKSVDNGISWNITEDFIPSKQFIHTTYATKNEVTEAVAKLVNSAPETLDTLGEIAKALQENDSVVEALNSSISNKADKTYVDNKLGDIQSLLEAI